MNEFKKYLVTIAIGLTVIILLDFLIGECLQYFYRRQTSGLLYRTTYAMEQTEADVLIFGTSRANHHYDPKIIQDSLGISAYNTGRDGNYIFYQTAVLRSVIKRYRPKKIVLDFSGSFEFIQEDYDRLSALLPYYSDHAEIRDLVLLKSEFERFKILCQSYRYNSLLTTIAIGNTDYNKTRRANKGSYQGFVSLTGVYEEALDSVHFPDSYAIDNTKVEVFEEFLNITTKENISLLVVVSPVYYLYAEDYSLELCELICKKYGVRWIDYSRHEKFLGNKELFKDQTHLNSKGSEVFTQMIVEALNDHSTDSTEN